MTKTPQEYGREGGLKTAKRGTEFYKAIGRKGGLAGKGKGKPKHPHQIVTEKISKSTAKTLLQSEIDKLMSRLKGEK